MKLKTVIIRMKNKDERKEEGKELKNKWIEQRKVRKFSFFPLVLFILNFLSIFIF
jgi:hypothetical protein